MTLTLIPVTPIGQAILCSDFLACTILLECAQTSIVLTPVVAI